MGIRYRTALRKGNGMACGFFNTQMGCFWFGREQCPLYRLSLGTLVELLGYGEERFSQGTDYYRKRTANRLAKSASQNIYFATQTTLCIFAF
jgi:hypothetical protein